eukprot:10848422-Alexandrium_andersonii.AAC.1
MEPKLIGLPAGPPWHLRGSGPGYAGTGAAVAAPTRRPPFRRSRRYAQHYGYEGPLGGIFARVRLF